MRNRTGADEVTGPVVCCEAGVGECDRLFPTTIEKVFRHVRTG